MNDGRSEGCVHEVLMSLGDASDALAAADAAIIYFSSTKQGKIGRSYAHDSLAGLASAEDDVHTRVYTCMKA